MTREYNHDDVCRGDDGCADNYRKCDVCPETVETACDLAYVSSMLGFIALRLDAAVA